jgi:adenine-specific DNA-methyltransferase
MIKYLGSKRPLLPWITSTIQLIHRYEPIQTILYHLQSKTF